ncbi:hypothetical protein BDF20DRAFT_844567 [Mycotypha africana]|uniref:uncharacterized protein n=1 Tax=Mycotypha africana TaxID=64632 RepID=UPI002300A9B9|nr:uncharacterized protein BDF20DRAFT_844567 [Mycotypha africana]KAI8991417.1 hypothetical protein BDF20DRAFT_844567 [Mycotypha africana]
MKLRHNSKLCLVSLSNISDLFDQNQVIFCGLILAKLKLLPIEKRLSRFRNTELYRRS